MVPLSLVSVSWKILYSYLFVFSQAESNAEREVERKAALDADRNKCV